MIPAKVSSPKPVKPATRAGLLPVYSLSVKESKESTEYVNLTGLFEKIMKDGVAYCGTAKEVNIKYWLFTNKNKATGELTFSLKSQDKSEDSSPFVLVANLLEKKTKGGKQLFVGEGQNGATYFINKVEQK